MIESIWEEGVKYIRPNKSIKYFKPSFLIYKIINTNTS